MACRSFRSSNSNPLSSAILKTKRQHSRLGVIQIQQAGEKQRPHLRDGSPHRVALFSEYVPESSRIGLKGKVAQLKLFHAIGKLRVVLARLADAGEVAFHIGRKYRNADAAEILSHHLQRDSFSRASGPGHEPVPVGHFRKEVELLL